MPILSKSVKYLGHTAQVHQTEHTSLPIPWSREALPWSLDWQLWARIQHHHWKAHHSSCPRGSLILSCPTSSAPMPMPWGSPMPRAGWLHASDCILKQGPVAHWIRVPCPQIRTSSFKVGCWNIYTDSNPLTYILTSVKLDATSYKWLAALSAFTFKLQ